MKILLIFMQKIEALFEIIMALIFLVMIVALVFLVLCAGYFTWEWAYYSTLPKLGSFIATVISIISAFVATAGAIIFGLIGLVEVTKTFSDSSKIDTNKTVGLDTTSKVL